MKHTARSFTDTLVTVVSFPYRLSGQGQKNCPRTFGLPTAWKLARAVNTRAFVAPNPTGELITSGLPVTQNPELR